jgi:exodeoxyribonuclease V alpha subunit
MESVRVLVWSIVHNTDDFYILSAERSLLDSGGGDRKFTCKGRLFGIQGIAPGVPIELLGKWVSHPKWGRQFDFNGWAPWAASEAGVESFFRNCLRVLDEFQVAALVDTFGVETFTILSERPSRLLEVAGFNDELVQRMTLAWTMAMISSDLSGFLSDHDVTSEQMQALFRAFGSEVKKTLSENPYRLLEVGGFSFEKADEVALSNNVELDDPRRYEGAVLWVLREAAHSGNLCVRRGDLAVQLTELLRTTEVLPFESIHLSEDLMKAANRLEARGGIRTDPDVGTYLPSLYEYERGAADYLVKFITPLKLEVELDKFLETYETVHQIDLSDAQRDAVNQLINNRVLVLTGGPGTGKTTVTRTFVELFERAGVTYALMAPTGIAAKRMASVTGRQAATIHRTFRYNGDAWGYNAQNKYPIGAIIIDECSMVDQELLYRTLDALEVGTILVLVGDDAQLPSVGPGNVLRELVRCPSVPTVRLTQIFRQAQQSEIILNSHRINHGEAIVPGDVDSDFRFISIPDDDKVLSLIVQMASKLKARDANFQVLSPKHDGVVGVTNLNNSLREVLNPSEIGKREQTFGTLRFREGDRLMVIKNDYDLGIYNGDMGKLIAIRSEYFTLRIHGIGEGGIDVQVDIPRKDVLSKLRLAYAITVHKSQGSEFDTVILPMVRSQGRMLQRNLFYTAVTRAKKKVWLLGDRGSIQRAINNDHVIHRNTGFGKAIQELMQKDPDSV